MADRPILIKEEAVWRNGQRAAAVIPFAVRKKGKDVLEELLTMLVSLVEQFRPWPRERGTNPNEDRDLFDRYVLLAMKCAAELAPCQSPKAVVIKDDRARLSDEQLLTLWQLLATASCR